MFYRFKNYHDLEKLNDLALLQSQVKALLLQIKPRKRNFYEDMKKVFQPITETIKDVSQCVTKTLTESSKENNKALANINNKFLCIMNIRCPMPSYLLSLLPELINNEHNSQTNLVNDPDSKKVNVLSINKTIPGTLYDNLLTFCDTAEKFELARDLLRKITNKDFNVDLASSPDKKLLYKFANEIYFDEKALRKKVLRKSLLQDHFNHLLSWLLGFPQTF